MYGEFQTADPFNSMLLCRVQKILCISPPYLPPEKNQILVLFSGVWLIFQCFSEKKR